MVMSEGEMYHEVFLWVETSDFFFLFLEFFLLKAIWQSGTLIRSHLQGRRRCESDHQVSYLLQYCERQQK